ncbi:hypothetical protein K491DRAFT_772753 [Lophiostoma macrostomum CBS 122681]|uniref:C3H1-type domain-containing protein n=1 Tax=Lophiostoma macrostomum CBS 122681 TaxID=1314788 RepID=A0A6A6TV67_9PLEO|nr:hypothetical protein K491DRAFT_772753 [Lophiostoma macrostomum CBS 122681]
MNRPPRPFLTEEEMRALSDQERAIAIAEWSSYNARLRREQEQHAARGVYRGGRGRGGRGRGRGYLPTFQPYGRGQYTSHAATFQQPAITGNPSVAHETSKTPPASRVDKQIRTLGALKKEDKTPCPAFTTTGNRSDSYESKIVPGVCKRPRCPHIHDPDKTAICRQFLSKGTCPLGQSCPLSHEPSPNRSPTCIHFQNSHCTKDDCRYAHVRIGIDAPVCEPFARLGYCEKGDTCADRHAIECPDHTNKGSCEVKGCRLPHIVHAARLRKARMSSSEAESPVEPGSPESEAEFGAGVDTLHALTQQADFVPFES